LLVPQAVGHHLQEDLSSSSQQNLPGRWAEGGGGSRGRGDSKASPFGAGLELRYCWALSWFLTRMENFLMLFSFLMAREGSTSARVCWVRREKGKVPRDAAAGLGAAGCHVQPPAPPALCAELSVLRLPFAPWSRKTQLKISLGRLPSSQPLS